jgi:N-methylhydantoinase B
MSRRAPTQFPFGFLTDDAGTSADPVLTEIVQGSLASVEMEVETAIARTSRSPMIRDAHDFRALQYPFLNLRSFQRHCL